MNRSVLVALMALATSACDEVLGIPGFDSRCPQPGDRGFHDEDGDGIDDTCDNCPGIANADQSNELERMAGAATDEVGDVCDPNPTLPGDHIARLESFATPLASATWSPLSGTWMFDGERLVATEVVGVDGILVDQLGEVAPFTVEYHVVLNTDLIAESGLFLDVDSTATDRGVRCGLFRSAMYGDTVFAIYDRGATASGDAEPLAAPFQAGMGYRVVMTYDPATSVRCVVKADSDRSLGQLAGFDLAPRPPPGGLTFEVDQASIAVDYLIVYNRP